MDQKTENYGKQERRKGYQEYQRILSLFDNISELIYIIDPKNYQIVYANKTATELWGGDMIGKTCYEVMQDRKVPCDFCENASLMINEGEVYRFETYDEKQERYYLKEAKMIDWPGYEKVRLETAIDITEVKRTHRNLEERVRYETELSNVSQQLLKEEMEEALQGALVHLQRASGASRVYIFENVEEYNLATKERKLYTKYAYEACAAGIKPQIDTPALKRFDLEPDFTRWKNQLSRGFYIAGDVEDFPPSEIEVLSSQGIQSLLVIPIFVEKKWYGFLGFDEVLQKRRWNEQDVGILNTAADMMGSYIEKKKRETAMKNSQKKLRVAMKNAQEANRQKSEFIANMSHEIRTPMNSIIGFAEILEKEIRDPEHRDYIQSIKQGGENLLTLMNDILDLSKIEAGMVKIEKTEVSLRKLIEEIKDIFELRAKQKNIRLQVEIQEDLPRRLWIDETRIRQILLNLVGNGIKFTDKGFVKIKTAFEKKDQRHGTLRIEVVDTGKGISKRGQKEVFKPFVQWNPKEDASQGTGLGLSITKNLVEILEGEIHLFSVPKRGTRFELTFYPVQIGGENQSVKNEKEEGDSGGNVESNNYSIYGNVETVLDYFDNQGKWDYRRVRNSAFFQDIRSFGETLFKLGQEQGVPALREYAGKLKESTDRFDIEGIKDLLYHYPNLIQRIKEHNNGRKKGENTDC
ncbi:ATP-binding protein [Isachenkonia alkalipeptolytica]|uniref:ATP-binding protein n=1 Tax=Isachenkonia alkalipeptolytica TaxID=2565777 RepID=UPI0013712B53|nr:ATP-binding protein [Isachenkonia alkalipeptolytica]